MIRSSSLIVATLFAGLSAHSSLGLTVFEDSFESAVSNPGDAAGSPVVGDSWTLFEDDAGDVSISGAANTGSQSALFQRLASDPFTTEARGNLTSGGTTSVENNGNALIEFAFLKSDQNDSSAIGIFGFSNGAAEDVISLRLDDDGNVVYYNGSSTIDTLLNYSFDSWQDIAIALDFANHTFTVSVEGATTAGATDIAFNANEDTLTSFDIIAGKDAVFRVDDVLITTVVPEPASVGLVTAGLALMLARRRR